MTREKSDNVEDGADEKMLDVDEKQQLARKDEVKFIAGNDRTNGDAKIDIGNIEKVRIKKIRQWKMIISYCDGASLMRAINYYNLYANYLDSVIHVH